MHRWERIVPLVRLQELAEKTVGPLSADQRVQLVPPNTWQRFVRWLLCFAGR
jgi:hypothetical protein